MKKNKIINAFNFLISEHHCLLYFEENHGNHYIFQNEVFKLKIYEWEQFDELTIDFICNDECFRINPYTEEPSLITKRKGLKGFFFIYSEEFWTIVARIVKNKINEKIDA